MSIINEPSFEEKTLNKSCKNNSGKEFYFNTRFIPEASNSTFDGIKKYLRSKDKRQVVNHYKTYYTSNKIKLSDKDLHDDSFFKVMLSRASTRDYTSKKIPFDVFSKFITASYGRNGRELKLDKHNTMPLRTVPSAGGLFPIELYIAIFNVQDIPMGIYHYNPINSELELLKSGDYRKEVIQYYQNFKQIGDSSALVMMTSVYNRTIEKYGERGWRFIFLDAGHIGQNLYLSASKLGIGITTLGGGYDADINRFLDLNDNEEVYVYGAVIGDINENIE